MNKKLILVGLVWLTALADIITFFKGGIFEFEINPLFVLTKSVLLIVGVKVFVLAGLTWLILKYEPHKTYLASYAICFMVVYAVLAQGLGAYSNLKTSHEYETKPKGEVVPMEPEQAIATYSKWQVLLFYIPILLSLIAFALFEWIYLDRKKIFGGEKWNH